MPRHVATGRDRSHLLDVSDMLVDGCRGDEIFLTEGRFNSSAIEMPFGAISLHTTWGPGKASAGVALQGFVNGQSEITVGACRGMPRLVEVHNAHDNLARS